MLVRRNAAFVPDVLQLGKIGRWFVGQPPCPLQHGFAHTLTPAVDAGWVRFQGFEQQIFLGIHDTEQVLETLAVMIGCVHMDVHPAGVVDFSACLPDTAHTLLEFLHLVIGELRCYHFHAIFWIGCSAIVTIVIPLCADTAIAHDAPLLALPIRYIPAIVIIIAALRRRSKIRAKRLCRFCSRDAGQLDFHAEALIFDPNHRSGSFGLSPFVCGGVRFSGS